MPQLSLLIYGKAPAQKLTVFYMKKIAILVPDLTLGGGQRVVVSTANLLHKSHDIKIILLNSQEKNLYETRVPTLNLKCTKKNTAFGKVCNILLRSYRLRKLIKKEKFDVIISFLESANLCAFLSNRNKSILTMHNKLEMLDRFDQLVLKYLLKYSPNIIAVSDGLKNELESNCSLKNVETIRNPIDPYLTQHSANEYKFSHPKKFIVSAGRLSYQKRFDGMIDAYLSSNSRDEFDLIIVGGGEDEASLQKKVKGHKNIFLLGQKKNPFPIIKAAEFYLQFSRTEAFPMVLLEAFSLSIPAVAYNCPTGLTELVKHNYNGLLVEEESTKAMSQSIDLMATDEQLRNRLSKNCLKSIEDYSPERTHQLWMTYLRSKGF